jgi:hypothetical protein
MRRFALIIHRARLLAEERWAADEGLGDVEVAQRRLARNAADLGLNRVPPWLRVISDGALRGLRAYQTLSSPLGWLIWPFLGLLSIGCVIGYLLGGDAKYLVGAAVGPLVVIVSVAIGVLYDVGRAILGSSNLARLIAAGMTGLVICGVLAMPFSVDKEGSWSTRGIVRGAALGLILGLMFQAGILVAYGRLWRRSPRDAT